MDVVGPRVCMLVEARAPRPLEVAVFNSEEKLAAAALGEDEASVAWLPVEAPPIEEGLP